MDVRNLDISGPNHKDGRLQGAVQLSLAYFTLQLSPLDAVYQLQEKKCESMHVYTGKLIKKSLYLLKITFLLGIMISYAETFHPGQGSVPGNSAIYTV